MAGGKPHADFLAAPEGRRWNGELSELLPVLRREAYALAGGWAWRVLPRGAYVMLRINPDFYKAVRIARKAKAPPDERARSYWAAELKVFREHLGITDWEQVEPGEPSTDPLVLEACYREAVPLGGKPPLRCAKCGGPAEPGADQYREILCNQCAAELGREESRAPQA